MIELLNSEQIIENRDCLKELLRYCHETSTGLDLPDSFYEEKMIGLTKYLKENKAFYFVAKDNDDIVGFLWACELNKNLKRIMHVLYFAVLDKYQKKGYGRLLMNALEELTIDIGIETLELNVNVSNHNAIEFYKKFAFYEEHITMKKDLIN